VRFDLPRTRAFFGLGDQTRARIEHRGTKGDLWIRNVTSYIPIPFVMTNDGLGLLVHTTRRVSFDLGATSPKWFGFEGPGAELDYFVFCGSSCKEIISRYTEVTGKPPVPPKWAMGLWFICRTQADAREFMDDCYTLGIPCDAISLEPGWMAKNYDFSVTKDWHPERFPVPSYARAGRRTFCFTPAGWAGLQRYTATWTGDTGGEEGPLGACLNLSLSGHGMSTCDMEVTTKEGIHFGMLLPWAQLNSWNYWRHPWYQGEDLKRIFTEYTVMRYRMIPYLYSCAWDAHKTGVPMLRAMPLEYPEDRRTHGLIRQYMLGPALLVGAFTKRIYLPKGAWYDYWTGQRFAGPKSFEPPVPADRGGPLLVRAGAIIPNGPPMQYVGQRPDDELTLHVYAGPSARFTLYEDDGSSFDYEKGAFRTTEIRHELKGNRLRVEMEGAVGAFTGAPRQRKLHFAIHGVRKPMDVEFDGAKLKMGDVGKPPTWSWDERTRSVRIWAGERDVRKATSCVIIGAA
jgi:alpha-glucosidase (family GH31 glycosyl hydrolase)